MTIRVNSTSHIRNAYRGRYFIAQTETASGPEYRVISASKLNELSPYVSSAGQRHYKFALHPGGYQNSWTQQEIARHFRDTGMTSPINTVQLAKLEKAGVIKVVSPAAQATQATSVEVPVGQFNGGYVIGTIVKGSGALSFASNPKVHATAESAEAEAQRLAGIHPGKEFIVFKACMSAVKATVVTRKF